MLAAEEFSRKAESIGRANTYATLMTSGSVGDKNVYGSSLNCCPLLALSGFAVSSVLPSPLTVTALESSAVLAA